MFISRRMRQARISCTKKCDKSRVAALSSQLSEALNEETIQAAIRKSGYTIFARIDDKAFGERLRGVEQPPSDSTFDFNLDVNGKGSSNFIYSNGAIKYLGSGRPLTEKMMGMAMFDTDNTYLGTLEFQFTGNLVKESNSSGVITLQKVNSTPSITRLSDLFFKAPEDRFTGWEVKPTFHNPTDTIPLGISGWVFSGSQGGNSGSGDLVSEIGYYRFGFFSGDDGVWGIEEGRVIRGDAPSSNTIQTTKDLKNFYGIANLNQSDINNIPAEGKTDFCTGGGDLGLGTNPLNQKKGYAYLFCRDR